MRLEEARKSLLGVDPPPDKQKKKPLQPPGGKKLQKSSVKPAQSVVITRSNNPKTKEVVKKAEKDKQEQKLPEYLNLLIQAIWLPFLLVQQIYKFGVYVGNLPGRIWTSTLYILSLPSIWLDSLCKFVVGLVTSPLCLWDWLIGQFEWLGQLFVRYHIGGLLVLLSAAYLFPATMTYPLFAIFRLVLGTLYPAYASYKAVRTKNVREYVKWMMYWIVFALFSGVETFADIFVAFWFPFYYEVKILFLLWLISPVSKGSLGSSILYRRFVHPALMRREDEIDHMILRLQDQGYNTVTRLGARAFTYVSNMVMQTAIKGGGGLVTQLKKSYSLTDLATNDETDFDQQQGIVPTRMPGGRRAIMLDTEDDFDDRDRSVSRRRTGSSGGGQYGRQNSSQQPYYFPEAEVRRRASRSRESPHRIGQQIKSADDLSSGYSSAGVAAEFLPVSTDTMDTEDYELYDPKIHGRRGANPGALPKLVPRGPNPRSRPRQEDVCSDDEPSRIKKYDYQGYPIQHSTSVSHDANKPETWARTYSRSSSISADSYYPSSDEYSILGDDILGEDNNNDDDDAWSDTFVDAKPPRIGNVMITEIAGSGDVSQFLMEEDGDKTPVKAPPMKTFTMDDLVKAAHKLQYDQDRMVYPVIQEKAQPAVAMANTARGLNALPPSGAKKKAPLPPSSSGDQIEPVNPPMKYPMQEQARSLEKPVSPPEVSMMERLPQIARPASRAGTNASSNEGRLAMEDLKYPRQEQARSLERPVSPSVVSMRERLPLVARPASRAGTSASSNEGRPIREGRPAFSLPEASRTPAAVAMPHQLSGSPPLAALAEHQASTSPSQAGKCPHCKIHSWLPHSAGCPKKK